MELKSFLKIFQKNIKLIATSCLIGTSVFGGFFLLTEESFLVEGTIFAYPTQSNPSEVTNQNYSRNLIAISNSPEFKKKLESEGLVSFEFTPLVGVTGGVKLREISPNILSLSIKDSSQEKSLEKFKKYFLILDEFSSYLKKGNFDFEISLIQENPIVTKQSSSLLLYLTLGLISGLFIVSFYLLSFKK
jgi:hypothetical protein